MQCSRRNLRGARIGIGAEEDDRARAFLDDVSGGEGIRDDAFERSAAVIHAECERLIACAWVAGHDCACASEAIDADVSLHAIKDSPRGDVQVGEISRPIFVGPRPASELTGLDIDEGPRGQAERYRPRPPFDGPSPRLTERPRTTEGGRTGIAISG